MGYADITYKDKNFIKRAFQLKRLDVVAKNLLRNLDNRDQLLNILDYGCGNAELLKYLNPRLKNFSYTGYDPGPEMIEEAKSNIELSRWQTLTFDKDDLNRKKFDVIFCLEVFEHLPEDVLMKELRTLSDLLNDEGILFLGVPNEIFLAALIRGAFRMTRRYGAFDANFKNIFLAIIGKPPVNRRVEGDTDKYLYYHMGFDHRKLLKSIKHFFVVNEVFGSPFPSLPVAFNTEVYIKCKKIKLLK